MDRLRFGTAGIPLRVKKRDTEVGIAEVVHLGLDAMEMEFVRGVKMGEKKAEAVRNMNLEGGPLRRENKGNTGGAG